MSWTHRILILVIAALCALPLTTALAQDGEKAKADRQARKAAAAERAAKLMQAVTDAEVSISQAATTAQTHSGGKAIAAAYKLTKNKLVVEVQVVVEGKKQKVTIDAATGEVQARPEKPEKGRADKPKRQKKQNKDDDRDPDEHDGEEWDGEE